MYQEEVKVREDSDYMNSDYSLVVDNDFLTLNPPPAISNSIKVFARISSENKAYIIKKFKNKISEERKAQGRLKRFFGDTKHKVGMAGDGANDLMAIR